MENYANNCLGVKDLRGLGGILRTWRCARIGKIGFPDRKRLRDTLLCVYTKSGVLSAAFYWARVEKQSWSQRWNWKSLEVVGACARAPWLSFGANQKHGETYKHARSLFPTASFLSNYWFIPSGGDPLQIISFYYYFLPPRCCYVCVCVREQINAHDASIARTQKHKKGCWWGSETAARRARGARHAGGFLPSAGPPWSARASDCVRASQNQVHPRRVATWCKTLLLFQPFKFI